MSDTDYFGTQISISCRGEHCTKPAEQTEKGLSFNNINHLSIQRFWVSLML